MKSEMGKKIKNVHQDLVTILGRVSDWNKIVPTIQSAEQWFAWMEESVDKAPDQLGSMTDETLLSYLDMAGRITAVGNAIPPVTPMTAAGFFASSGSLTTAYIDFVRYTAVVRASNPEVTQWANATITLGNALREKQNRSGMVHHRLIQLNPALGELHDKCTNATLAAKAGTQNPIEAAANQNRLLEQFKGHLIDKCRHGSGVSYRRISDNLAIDSPFTKSVVSDGQDTYDRLNREYVAVRKSLNDSTGNRLMELLRDLEDHIYNVTNALDPARTGLTFFTD